MANVILLESGSATLLEDNFDLLLESGIPSPVIGSAVLGIAVASATVSAAAKGSASVGVRGDRAIVG